jgi:hypothetical protein
MQKGIALMAIVVAAGMIHAPQAQAKDSCATVLCMFGMLEGAGVSSACKGPIEDYFSIIKFGSHGQMLTGHTNSAREKFTGSCSSASPDVLSKINSKYGRVRR